MPTSRPTRSPRRAAELIVLPRPAPSPALLSIHQAIVTCERCPRLRAHCRRMATIKKAAFRDQTYWGRPVPGFGDPDARVLLIGLAPAAHGANRTGRVFTGDGAGGSGDFLMRALHDNQLASQPTSRGPDDGLQLTGAVHRGRGALRPARQQAHTAGARALPALPRRRVERTSEPPRRRLSRPHRFRHLLARAARPRVRRPPASDIRPWRALPGRRRAARARRLSPQPPEHQHRPAHTTDARGRVRESAADCVAPRMT